MEKRLAMAEVPAEQVNGIVRAGDCAVIDPPQAKEVLHKTSMDPAIGLPVPASCPQSPAADKAIAC
jgi:hypothetical protein